MKYLKLERVKRDLTQQYIGDYLGIRREKYSKIELGYLNMLDVLSVKEVRKLASLYNISFDEFVRNYEKSLGKDVKDLVNGGLF